MSDTLELPEPTRSDPSAGAPRRTFAIISHPDAGKTTLTEKLLYFGGAIQMAGQVKARGDRRRTRSDWLEIERARGISVTSSVMTFEHAGIVFNLLDTPGHADFSEDTYRTLSAVDAAVMVIDAAKGIESQTRKLFEVCRLRDIPIITFINKIDREGHDPLALLDEISSGLALDLTVLTWPIGMGVDFRGVLDVNGARLLLPAQNPKDAFGRTEPLPSIARIDHPDVEERIAQPALESLALCLADLPAFDAKAFREGHLSPVIFGSALKDFGVGELLDCLARFAPDALPRKAQSRDRRAGREDRQRLRVQGPGQHGPEPPRPRRLRAAVLGKIPARDAAVQRARKEVDERRGADLLLRAATRDGRRGLSGRHHRPSQSRHPARRRHADRGRGAALHRRAELRARGAAPHRGERRPEGEADEQGAHGPVRGGRGADLPSA